MFTKYVGQKLEMLKLDCKDSVFWFALRIFAIKFVANRISYNQINKTLLYASFFFCSQF